MDDRIIESIVSVGGDVLMRSLPFLIFGFYIRKKFKPAAILFIISSSFQIAARLAAETRRYAIREMSDSGIPTSEIGMSLQNQLPGILSLLGIGLMICALFTLARAIDRAS